MLLGFFYRKLNGIEIMQSDQSVPYWHYLQPVSNRSLFSDCLYSVLSANKAQIVMVSLPNKLSIN